MEGALQLSLAILREKEPVFFVADTLAGLPFGLPGCLAGELRTDFLTFVAFWADLVAGVVFCVPFPFVVDGVGLVLDAGAEDFVLGAGEGAAGFPTVALDAGAGDFVLGAGEGAAGFPTLALDAGAGDFVLGAGEGAAGFPTLALDAGAGDFVLGAGEGAAGFPTLALGPGLGPGLGPSLGDLESGGGDVSLGGRPP